MPGVEIKLVQTSMCLKNCAVPQDDQVELQSIRSPTQGSNMRIRLDKVIINDFKRIGLLEIDLQPVTALVGGNTSGKSSALQAAQLGVSILQAALRIIRANGVPDFAGTGLDRSSGF